VSAQGPLEASLPPVDELATEAGTLAERLFPFPRSLTGGGVRETLRSVADVVSIDLHEVPSGTPVLDWTVPPEWNLREAWIEDQSGRRIVDARDHPLHILGYSAAVETRITGRELQEHLWSLPERPELIPARTSYWERRWGFCLADTVRRTIRDDELYDVHIEATHDEAGSMTYGEGVVAGRTDDELLLSTYVCHPGLANDGVSGIVAVALLGRYAPARTLHHSVRLLFAPATIGAIAWLALNEKHLDRIKGGAVVSCVGDSGPLHVKRSRRGDTAIDRAGVLLAQELGGAVRPFEPWGTDERQFDSPGYDLPIIAVTRTPHGEFPEHHTSADDLAFLDPTALAESVHALARILDAVDRDRRLVNLLPKGEPRLGERGLYPTLSAGVPGAERFVQALLWVLSLSDGRHSLLDVAERSGIPFSLVADAADSLAAHGLVAEQKEARR
jgi:aminopeptidase-like protein